MLGLDVHGDDFDRGLFFARRRRRGWERKRFRFVDWRRRWRDLDDDGGRGRRGRWNDAGEGTVAESFVFLWRLEVETLLGAVAGSVSWGIVR